MLLSAKFPSSRLFFAANYSAVPSQFLRTLITLPVDHLNSHGTSKGSLGDLELAFDRFRDVLHERLAIKHKLGMLFCATLA